MEDSKLSQGSHLEITSTAAAAEFARGGWTQLLVCGARGARQRRAARRAARGGVRRVGSRADPRRGDSGDSGDSVRVR